MKTKNKFDTFDKLDDFDKMLFEHYKNQDENIPLSTENAIKNAFNDKHKSNSTVLIMFKKVAVFILAIGIITTTTVYAKDIVNFITNIFADNNRGIDTAIDNGYVQNVDMDYIVCNDVGVKVDYLLMDDKNLNISFVYKYFGEEAEVESMNFSDLIIKDENENILCLLEEGASNVGNLNILGTTSKLNMKKEYIDNETIRYPLLITTDNSFPLSHILSIQINQIALIIDNVTKHIVGNWSFSINLDNNIITRFSDKYLCTESPYVDKVITSLTDTSLSIELTLNTLFDASMLYVRNAIILKDMDNIVYKQIKMLSHNYNSYSTITLLYPITTYDNINKLHLQINLDAERQVNLELSK